jgi:hypothetical protein
MTTTLSSAVVEVRQGTWDDMSEKHMFRVTPFTDIQYSGPEVAAMNSVIASCLVPTVCGVSRNQTTGYMNGEEFSALFTNTGDAIADFANGEVMKIAGKKPKSDTISSAKEAQDYETLTGTGLADFLLGYGAYASAGTFKGTKASRGSTHSNFSRARQKLFTTNFDDETALGGSDAQRRRPSDRNFNVEDFIPGLARQAAGGTSSTSNLQRIAGTYPIRVEQFASDEIAYDVIANNPQSLTIGYTMDSRAVNMVFTQSAISMIVRRLHRAVERYGPSKPVYTHVGLGHAVESKGKSDGICYDVTRPSMLWNAGAIAYANKRLNAQGSLYIPQDQVPYSMMKRGFKYNHILTLLGLELIETLNAVGADMSTGKDGNVKRRSCLSGSVPEQIAMLQILFSSVFGSVRGATNAADFEADPVSIADSVKESIGMLFNSGHIHLDPGFLTYLEGAWNGSLLNDSEVDTNLKYKGRSLTPAQMMSEFVAKYVTFVTAVTAFKPYFQVPLYDCHWLYVGSPKPEYVIEQLQMNYRPDVIFEGGASMPEFTLIPAKLNPGEVLERIPTLFDSSKKVPNTYLGIRDPLPYGSVSEIRFHGDRPLTTIEEREYDFTPIIEADSSVNQVMRNGRILNIAVLPRPSMYIPGASHLGAISGMMSDNASVGGSYYFQQHNGPYFNDSGEGGTSKPLRQVGQGQGDSKAWAQRQLAGTASDSRGAVAMQRAIDQKTVKREDNPQKPGNDRDMPVVPTGGPALSYLGQAVVPEDDESV